MNPLPSRIANALILVADDIEFNRRIIVNVLKKNGFNAIETAVDGRDALEKTYRLKPAIVLLDLIMPVLDGFTYCEHVRKDESFAFMPIIVQTASDERKDKLRALSCGADDFVYKPLDQSELVLRVCLHLQRQIMLSDMNDTRQYLAMELEQAHRLIRHLKQSPAQEKAVAMLDEHCEVIKMISLLHDHKVA
jgi:putative two-component system response regulator